MDRFFIVHEETGSCFEVDKDTFEAVQCGVTPEDVEAVLPEVPSTDWLKNRLENEPRHFSALCLNVTHMCNMACTYCFAQQGDYGGSKGIMSEDVAKAAVDRLMKSPSSWVDIDFFGGEPLLAWETVSHTLIYAREQAEKNAKRIRFSLTTNGLLLNEEKLDFLDEYGVNLTLSIDGPKEIHDTFRVDKAGNGTFERSIAAFKEVERRRKGSNYFVRGTFTHQTLDFSDYVKFLVNEGFKTISMEPVTGQGMPWSITTEDLPKIRSEYEKLASFYIEKALSGERFYYYHFELNPINPPSVVRRFTGCGAGVEYVVVNPQGYIYPCHQFDNVATFSMGNVLMQDVKAHPDFLKAHALNKAHCKDCWARALCGGGCHAENYFSTGSIYGQTPITCEIVKMRLQYALAANAILQK
ncbi:radical SAM/SPASM domain-containing protein [Coprothermobacter platensis]|uniref:radical SAM/SPASM domain-containing protein n=1 Tax=Coprothermobacter platensis TaxID=108819 RepID=UPI0003A3B36B|nr:radical SAM protein [Coprothermobacter platensis]